MQHVLHIPNAKLNSGLIAARHNYELIGFETNLICIYKFTAFPVDLSFIADYESAVLHTEFLAA